MNYKDNTLDEIRQMLNENERDRQFGVAVTTQPNNPELHPINQGFTTKNVVREMMMDQYNDGWLLQYPEPVGVVIQQPRRPISIGENQNCIQQPCRPWVAC